MISANPIAQISLVAFYLSKANCAKKLIVAFKGHCIDIAFIVFPSRSEPGVKVGSEPRAVVDLAVWIPGRIVFNSKPWLLGGMEGYQVFGADISIVNSDHD